MKFNSAKNTTALSFTALALATALFSLDVRAQEKAAPAKASKEAHGREIEFHIESVEGKTHWMPMSVEVHPGEELTLVFHHDLKTGPDFHGVQIPELKILDKVTRGKEARFKATVPADLKTKEIGIKCQFHPAHQPAFLKLDDSKKAQ